jgi:hypothetical protein
MNKLLATVKVGSFPLCCCACACFQTHGASCLHLFRRLGWVQVDASVVVRHSRNRKLLRSICLWDAAFRSRTRDAKPWQRPCPWICRTHQYSALFLVLKAHQTTENGCLQSTDGCATRGSNSKGAQHRSSETKLRLPCANHPSYLPQRPQKKEREKRT